MGSTALTQFIGILLGFLSGLGIGGGSLLILWLTLAVGMAPEEARTVNLLFFLPAAAVSLLLHHRQGRVDFRRIFPAILGGCASALLFSQMHLSTPLLRKLFGFLLMITGLRELFCNEKREGR